MSSSLTSLKSLPLTADKLREDEMRVSARARGLRSTPRDVPLLDSAVGELLGISDSLLAWASSLNTENHAAAKALTHHASSLKRICGVPEPEALEAMVVRSSTRKGSITMQRCSSRKSTIPVQDDDAIIRHLERFNTLESRQRSVDEIGYRQRAAQVLEQSGRPGEAVDDLAEVPVAEIKDRLAISYWRFCEGLRLYRSPTVTEAMRLICSAAVPGLGETSYLQVFDTLTKSTAWEQHVYIFGGLVRDVLRRTVGNDIDIGFSAPAAELQAICKQASYQNEVDGDYIIIGDGSGEEYLEGMVISFNGIQPPEHADFSMNMLFYDFRNDVVVDKTGKAVPAIVANRLELPCPRDRWKSWIEINGVRVCFRYYKFLLRGYGYDPEEMRFVVDTMMDFWRRDVEHTIEVGRIALGGLVGCKDPDKIENLRKLVFQSFDMAVHKDSPAKPRGPRRVGRAFSADVVDANRFMASPEFRTFLSAKAWWEKGWLVLLNPAA